MSTDAYQVLRHEILSGTLMPGDRLRLADLNDRYRLGLTPIREALMRLTSEGLVSWQSYRGASVAGIDIEEFRDMVRTRRAIERLCLTQAMELGDAAWEAEIMRSFHLLKRTPVSGLLRCHGNVRHLGTCSPRVPLRAGRRLRFSLAPAVLANAG